MIAMPITSKKTAAAVVSKVLCGIANREIAEALCREIEPSLGPGEVFIAEGLPELVDYLAQAHPRVILLDDELVAGAPVLEFFAPVERERSRRPHFVTRLSEWSRKTGVGRESRVR
jgi:hypothetical protein